MNNRLLFTLLAVILTCFSSAACVNLSDAGQVGNAVARMAASCEAPDPSWLVQKMVTGGVELILTVRTADARPFLQSSRQRYDLILIDAYRQPYVPFYLATREFFALCRDRLR